MPDGDLGLSISGVELDVTWIPTVDELGSRMYARTLTSDGARVGTFNAKTSPTGDQADVLIGDAAAVVSGVIGTEIPDALIPLAKYAVIARAAMSVERGYYPAGEDSADSTYSDWDAEYSAAIAAIETALNDDGPNRPRMGSIGLAVPRRQIYVGPVEAPLPGYWLTR